MQFNGKRTVLSTNGPRETTTKLLKEWASLSSPVVESSPTSAGDTGSTPGQRRSHMSGSS